MKLSELYPSKYLTKDDIGAGQKYTITSVNQENVGRDDNPEIKPILHFQEINKPLVLNKTNGETIGEFLGNDTDLWTGKEIVVYFDPTIMFGGKKTGGLRVRPPKGAVPEPSSDLPF